MVVGRCLAYILRRFDVGVWAESFLHGLVGPADAPYLGSALLALLSGLAGAHLFNFGIQMLSQDRQRTINGWIVSRYDNGLLHLLNESIYANVPISFTLCNRKVYIGYVTRIPNTSPHDQFVTVALLLSGYRCEETYKMHITTNYANRIHPRQENPLVFEVMFSVQQISTANTFDLAVYQSEFASLVVPPSGG